MLYSRGGKNFKQHVHPNLQRRIRIFLALGAVMLAVVLFDIYQGSLNLSWALVSLALGACVGLITSRIFSLSWSQDGRRVVGRIDAVGWVVLVAYLIFEIVRATLFATVLHTGSDPNAITFAFVSAALMSRVLGLRGRIINVLKSEKIFG